jgi:hypothetical protein
VETVVRPPTRAVLKVWLLFNRLDAIHGYLVSDWVATDDTNGESGIDRKDDSIFDPNDERKIFYVRTKPPGASPLRASGGRQRKLSDISELPESGEDMAPESRRKHVHWAPQAAVRIFHNREVPPIHAGASFAPRNSGLEQSPDGPLPSRFQDISAIGAGFSPFEPTYSAMSGQLHTSVDSRSSPVKQNYQAWPTSFQDRSVAYAGFSRFEPNYQGPAESQDPLSASSRYSRPEQSYQGIPAVKDTSSKFACFPLFEPNGQETSTFQVRSSLPSISSRLYHSYQGLPALQDRTTVTQSTRHEKYFDDCPTAQCTSVARRVPNYEEDEDEEDLPRFQDFSAVAARMARRERDNQGMPTIHNVAAGFNLSQRDEDHEEHPSVQSASDASHLSLLDQTLEEPQTLNHTAVAGSQSSEVEQTNQETFNM